MNGDSDLALKPLAFDVLDRLMVNDGTFTKTDLMRSYHDTQCKIVHYRMSEMLDLGWIAFREYGLPVILVTAKGAMVHRIIASMMAKLEEFA